MIAFIDIWDKFIPEERSFLSKETGLGLGQLALMSARDVTIEIGNCSGFGLDQKLYVRLKKLLGLTRP